MEDPQKGSCHVTQFDRVSRIVQLRALTQFTFESNAIVCGTD